MADLSTWAAEAADLGAPKPLQMAKALRQRKQALTQPPRQALSGGGNIFQRRRQGIDDVVSTAVK